MCIYVYMAVWIMLQEVYSIDSIVALSHLRVILELWLRLYENWGNWLEAQKQVSQGSVSFILYSIFQASISEDFAADIE